MTHFGPKSIILALRIYLHRPQTELPKKVEFQTKDLDSEAISPRSNYRITLQPGPEQVVYMNGSQQVSVTNLVNGLATWRQHFRENTQFFYYNGALMMWHGMYL